MSQLLQLNGPAVLLNRAAGTAIPRLTNMQSELFVHLPVNQKPKSGARKIPLGCYQQSFFSSC
eukprot:4375319-Pleurochrysis_carterae.AAC.1